MSQKAALAFIVLFLCGMTLYRGGHTLFDFRPDRTGLDPSPIDPTMDPIQENLPKDKESFTKDIDGVKALLTVEADYKIAGRVVSKRHYYMNWLSKLSPVDLALAWGEFSSTKYDDHLSYSHSDRYYSYRYEGSFSGNPNDIATHSANEHLIPANELIAKAIKSIKENEIIEITGKLVNIEWMDKDKGAQNLNTSLTRDDTGAGACEIIYVTRVKIKSDVYE